MKQLPFNWSYIFSFKLVTAGLLSFAMVGMLPLAAVAVKPVKLTASQRQRLEQSSAPLMARILQLAPLALVDGEPLSVTSVLKRTLAVSPQVSLHQEQLKEGELKFHRVASKRLLFLFKYLNASYLEGAAFNDIKANEAQAQEAEQRLLLETATLYYQWLNGYVGRLLSYESIQQGLGQLRINQDEFDTGESTSFDVLETEHQVLDRYRLYVAEEATTTLTLQSLLSGLNLPVAEADATANQHRYYPAGLTQLAMPALTHEGKVTQSLPKLVMLEPLQAIPATWTEKTVRALALDHRPSSQEARFRLASVQQLTKAASYDFDKRQGEFLASAVRQLQLKQHIVDQQLAQEARQAWQVYVSLVQQQEVVSQQLAVAQRFYQQRLASQRAGFANNNDVLQSQVLLTQAVLALTKAQAAINLQELKLRYVTGTLLDYVKTQQ